MSDGAAHCLEQGAIDRPGQVRIQNACDAAHEREEVSSLVGLKDQVGRGDDDGDLAGAFRQLAAVLP